jgi:uncharacterized protein (DUF736 family)
MTIIGNFTKQDGAFAGTITTLSINSKVTIQPAEKANDKAPDFRVFSGKAEIGGAWSATSKAGKSYLSVKLDDPSFAAPIQCRLIEIDKCYALVWSR